MSDGPHIDTRELRKALGCFVTGVTVITTVDSEGVPRGFTANSFTSVSLDPPLVSVCLNPGANSYGAFSTASSFAVNILSEAQRDVSGVFASKQPDKFSAAPWHPGQTGSPVIEKTAAWLDCVVHARIEAGDHVILIGRVVDFAHSARTPLGYYAGSYVSFGLERHAESASHTAQARVGGIFERDGAILLVEHGGKIRLPTGRSLGEEAPAPESLFARLAELQVRAATTFVYNIWDQPGSGRMYIYYRGEILEGPPPGSKKALLAPFDAIPWGDLSEGEELMLRRYVSERLEARFGIYVGTPSGGRLASLASSGGDDADD